MLAATSSREVPRRIPSVAPRVHAAEPAAGVNEGAAGVAPVKRGVALIFVYAYPAPSGSQRPSERALHASRHRVLVAIWVADGYAGLAGSQAARIAEYRR